MAVHYSWDDIGGFRVFAADVLISCSEKTRKKIETLSKKLKQEAEKKQKQKQREFFAKTKSEIIKKHGEKMFFEIQKNNIYVSQMISFADAIAAVPYLFEYQKREVELFVRKEQWRYCPDFAPNGWNCHKTAIILQIAAKLQQPVIQIGATQKPFECLRFLELQSKSESGLINWAG